MKSITVSQQPVANMSDTSLCNSQPHCNDGEVADEEQEDVLGSDLSSTEHGLETMSSSTEDVTSQTDDCSHYVTWTVHFALAVPRGEEADVPDAAEKTKTTHTGSCAVLAKAHKAQSCHHIEYHLLPGDTEPVKVDLVWFGPVAKMYKEDEIKILRTWQEGDQIWVCWTQNFRVRVSRNMLISLIHHKIKLQIWNSKDKLCSQARYERLKAFRTSQSEDATDLSGGIKNMVERLRSLCEKKKAKNATLLNSSSYVSSETDANLDPQMKTGFPNLTTDAYDLEDMKKNGTTSAQFSPILLMAGETSVAEHFQVYSCGVFEIICNISLDGPLMSHQLKAELNPLVITVLSTTSLPSSPVPFHVLQEKCMPVYCQYKFHNLSMHRTNYHKHAANIYFRDVNVILSGLMNPQELQEFLSGPPLQIEVHDRDRKVEKPNTAVMSDKLSDYGTQRNVKQKLMPFNYHGIGSLNLSELLLGKKRIQVQLPIKCCPPPLLLDRERSTCNSKGTVASREPIPPGHYIDANSQLKVKVELACPFNVKNYGSELESYHGPFGRIIYIFDYNNFSVMTKLRSEILKINASAFHLGSCSLKDIEQALANYTMNFKRDESEDLDFVTGFHVLDKRTQIFVLEGLKQKAVRRLWEAVPMKLSGSEKEQVIVLYNSNLGFFKRLYDSLDVGLSPVYLYKPLENIMRQPLVYIRGMVPQACFQALSRLSQLCQIRQLSDVVQYNLLPSADMILSMSKEYGTYAEQLEQKAKLKTEVDIITYPVRMKRHALLCTHNSNLSKWKHNSKQKDFIQENIKKVREESERLQKPEAAVLRVQQAEGRPAHNYSIQSFNSNEQNNKLLQKEMAKVPGRRFTYSQQFYSATVEPGEVISKKESSSAAVSTVWNTSMSSDKSVHSRLLDEARVEELRKPWRENILHANTLKPILSRDRWAWSQRYEDFQLYSKPPPFFSTPPVTIHLAGDLLLQEQLEAARAQYSRWLKRRLPAGSTSPPTCPNFKCYMGENADKMQHILKDEPKKYSLRKPGLMLKPVPQLSVMNLPYAEEKCVALAPGPCNNCSLSSRNNAIPRHASLYNKYHYIGFTKQHSFLDKRTALPLTDQEKIIFTFQK